MLREHLLNKGLSHREAEVAMVVATGVTNQDAANKLFVTEKTIKFHLTNIYKKLQLKSRSQLIIWCSPHMTFIEDEPQKEEPIPHGMPKLPTPERGNC